MDYHELQSSLQACMRERGIDGFTTESILCGVNIQSKRTVFYLSGMLERELYQGTGRSFNEAAEQLYLNVKTGRTFSTTYASIALLR